MAFIGKSDYCGLAITNKLVLSGDSQNASGSVVTAQDSDGSSVASTFVYGGATPSNQYDVKADVPFTSTDAIKLGSVSAVGQEKYMLTGVQIATSTGGSPTVSGSAAHVESAAVTGMTYNVTAFTLPMRHRASILFGEGTLSGAGCAIIGSSYNIASEPSIERDEDGNAISSGIHNGRIEATLTIQQSSSTAPTFTEATSDGWTLTSPLTQTNGKGAYPTWTVSLVKYLTATQPVVSQ